MNPSEQSNSINKDDEIEINQNKVDNLNLEDQNNLNDEYAFGWSQYSEITNGRFAMIGFAAIILIEMISKKSFLVWAGIIH
tara:strand:+ start:154 stop:396 length:243 start_codon:yes stop_codon:yes gene_type:complete